jgi:hypothetical protein
MAGETESFVYSSLARDSCDECASARRLNRALHRCEDCQEGGDDDCGAGDTLRRILTQDQ